MQIEKSCKSEEDDEERHQTTTEHLGCVEESNDHETMISTPFSDKSFVSCDGCGDVIYDSSFLVVENLIWHVTCLKCFVCRASLSNEETCFIKNGKVYCKGDYQGIFGLRSCERCGVSITSQELVMRVRDSVYHADGHCFSCSRCKRPLVTGEKFTEKSGKLRCWSCVNSDEQLFDGMKTLKTTGNKLGRPRKRKNSPSTPPDMRNLQHNVNFNNDLQSAHKQPAYPGQKSKRVRTSFKHHQLCAMKAYFDSNHNPDAKDLKQLAQETGLTKRVLQVWFQNARAKYRRNCLQNDSNGGNQSKSMNSAQHSKSDCCLDLSDSVSSTFEASPASEIGSEDARSFDDEEDDTNKKESYSNYSKSLYHLENTPHLGSEEDYRCSPLSMQQTSSSSSSITSAV